MWGGHSEAMKNLLTLPKISLNRPVTVTMVFVAFLVVGFIAYTRIPISLMPGGQQSRWVHVYVSYGNASPVEVERRIARPVEGIFRAMTGVERISSRSSSGGCGISIVFRQGVDMAEAYNQLRDRCDRVLAELPDDVKRIHIWHWDPDSWPILGISVLYHGNYTDLYTLVEEQIKKPLERLDGVARVDVYGTRSSRVQIDLSRARMNASGVNAPRLFRQLQQDNFAMSSGWVSDGSQKLYVRSDSRFTSVEEIRNLPIAERPGLSLRDVANVEYTKPRSNWRNRLNGLDGVWVSVKKKASANTVDVSRRVLETFENDLLKRPQLTGFEPHVYFNQGEEIESALDQLQSAGLWGGLFAVLVLYFFLRRGRTTFVVAGAIPLSITISLIVFYFAGWSLNMVTMMGLIISFGMVVDNSIVVAEAIHARRVEGAGSSEASLYGASEVGLAITVATLTTLVVFLPLIFLGGGQQASFYMARLGMPVVYALLASLFVALFFIPLAMRHLMSEHPTKEARIITLANGWYRKGLSWVMAHRLEAAIAAVALFMTIQIPMGKVTSHRRGGHGSYMSIGFDMPRQYDVAAADTIMTQYETFLSDRKEQYGLGGVEVSVSRGRGHLWSSIEEDRRAWYTVTFHKIVDGLGFERQVPMTREEIFDDIKKHAPRFPGVEMSIDRQQDDAKRTSVTLFGENTSILVRLATEVERRLRLLPQVTEVDSDVESAKDELQFRVNRRLADHVGVDSRSVASTIGTVMRGTSLNRFHTEEREIPIRLELDVMDRQTVDQVLDLRVSGSDSTPVTVRSLVDVTMGKTLRNIRRENGRTRVRVTAISREEGVGNLREHVVRALDGLEMPRGYQCSLTGRFEQMKEEEDRMTFAIVMAIAFVFLLMGVLFESFILPLSVVMSIPFSFLGVYWLLHWTDTPLDRMGTIGMVVLIGVVVNNAIVLVDLINRLRSDGDDRLTAIMEAGRRRFRPILMSSATTVFGLLPVTLGDSKMFFMRYDSLGVVMIGGLVTSMFLTLFVVPLFYTLLEDLRATGGRVLALVLARSP